MEKNETEAVPMSDALVTDADDSPKKPRKSFQRGFRSGVWSHFLRATDGLTAKCMHCNRLIRTKDGTTSGLLVHLRSKHKINARVPLPESRRKSLKEGLTGTERTSNRRLRRCPDPDESLNKHLAEEFQDGIDTSSDESTPTPSKTVFVCPKVEPEEVVNENSDEEPGGLLRMQLNDDQSENHYPEATSESYQKVDDQEITLFSLRNKSNSELKDIVLHLQYKCQATEIECQRVKTKLALLRLSHCQSALVSTGRVKNGRIATHVFKKRPNSLKGGRRTRNHSSSGEDNEQDDPDFRPA